ncbi:MAG: NAD(+)/NADH kinase [Actinomycetota bacterium]
MSQRLGLVIHQHRAEVIELATEAIDWCRDHEVRPVLPTVDAELVGRPDLGVGEADFGIDLNVCLSLGGDGTMLRATALVAAHDVPILGVNAGHLGYLTEVDPPKLIEALDRWLAGEMRIERRMMVEVSIVDGENSTFVGRALNEAVIDRSESGRAVEVAVNINGSDFITFLADGLIVATPTGSTAYSLSAGGPIVEPDFRTLLLTPVAAHTVFNRPMVLGPRSEIRLTIEGHRPAVVALDGQLRAELKPGESVSCRASEVEVSFLVSGDRDFHLVLKEKFGLTDR